MIGNAVAVPVVKWVGEQLMNVHRATYPVTPIG
jgi:site-specific DNA-cytosine methylase